MAKAAITHSAEAPSESIIKKANERRKVEDARGRTLELKKLAPLDRMRMSKAAGSENAINQPYMLYALVACSVVSIDGDDLITPTNERHLEAAIARLGDEGYEAALNAVLEMYGAPATEDVVEAAKK